MFNVRTLTARPALSSSFSPLSLSHFLSPSLSPLFPPYPLSLCYYLSPFLHPPFPFFPSTQGVTKRRRLSLLTNSAPVLRVQMRGEGGSFGVSANEYSCAHHATWSPNKLWRSISIFNLCFHPCQHSKKITEPMLSNSMLHLRHIHWGNTCLFLPPTTSFTVTVNEIKDTQFVLLI